MVLRLAALLIILFAALNILPDSAVVEPYAPPFITVAVAVIKETLSRFWDRFPDTFTSTALGLLAIENLLWTALMLAICCFVAELLVRDNLELNSPFDRLAESPGSGIRFLWLVLGLTVLCIAAVPTLIVVGQVILHLRMHGGDLMTRGWAR